MKELLKDIYRTCNPYFQYRKYCPVKEKTILYEAFAGRNMSCNPYGIFKELLRDEAYNEYHHVWVLEDFEDNAFRIREYENYSNVEFVKFKSKKYHRWLATAQYLINNSTFPEYFICRKEQIYLNTWHGIPLKSMGYDMKNGPVGSANTMRNFFQASYLLSPNSFHSRMYGEAYKMKGIYPGRVLETGQARTDLLFGKHRREIFERLREAGVKVEDGKKIILYAPTWKGEDFSHPKADEKDYEDVVKYLESHIDTRTYQVLVKPHQIVYKELKKRRGKVEQMVPATLDANEVLSVTDVLISDYSSIFFDFLVTGRPVLFYISDLAQYQDSRGLYQNMEELPGPAVDSLEELCSCIAHISEISEEWKERYEKVRQWACPYDDGEVSRRIVDAVFAHKKPQKGRVCRYRNDKKKLLLFLGALNSNGITYSAQGLLENMDYSRYDVTLYIYKPSRESEENFMNNLPEEARVLVHTRSAIGNPLENAEFLLRYEKGIVHRIGLREYYRMFGRVKFDYVVDFVGYSPLFSAVAGSAPYGDKSIWQHNDMLAEFSKRVNGKRTNYRRLKRVFKTYPMFDQVVSCSRAVMEINEKNLGERYGAAQPRFVLNTMNLRRSKEGCAAVEAKPGVLCDTYMKTEVSMDSRDFWFVNMGRMSTEKNQETLIRAFARLEKEAGRSIGLVILGEGALRDALEHTIRETEMEGKVILTGNLENPFVVLKRCSCFVLPSLHEGQPVSVLEARVLGLGIIVGNFSTVSDVLLKNGQIVCGTSEDEVYEALRQALCQGMPSYTFDGEVYNREVMAQFYEKIEK